MASMLGTSSFAVIGAELAVVSLTLGCRKSSPYFHLKFKSDSGNLSVPRSVIQTLTERFRCQKVTTWQSGIHTEL